MTNPAPDAPHTADDLPLYVEDVPDTEAVDPAGVDERLDDDPESVPNATDPEGVLDTDVDPMA